MELEPYVDSIRRQLAVAAEAGGDEARALAERLMAPLDAALRLTLQDALAAAAAEITCELAPGSVELRLRGRDPAFVVTPPPAEPAVDGDEVDPEPPTPVGAVSGDADDGAVARINLRLPDQLKARVEQAASREGLSVNSWLVRAAAAAVDRGDRGPRRDPRPPSTGRRYTGWAR